MNLTELTKVISEAVAGTGTTVDPATIPIQVMDPEFSEPVDILKVEYDVTENLVILTI